MNPTLCTQHIGNSGASLVPDIAPLSGSAVPMGGSQEVLLLVALRLSQQRAARSGVSVPVTAAEPRRLAGPGPPSLPAGRSRSAGVTFLLSPVSCSLLSPDRRRSCFQAAVGDEREQTCESSRLCSSCERNRGDRLRLGP